MPAALAMERPFSRFRGDGALLGAIVLLAGLGMVNLYSASYGYAMALGLPPHYFALRQLMWALPALAVFAAAYAVPLDWLRPRAGAIILTSLLLLVLPFLPGIGIAKNGAFRWFGLGGLMFQPSELFKPALVLYLAHILSKKADRLSDVVNAVIPPLLVAAAGMAVILLQNDFSTAMLVGALAAIMFWIARVPVVFFAALGSVGLPLASLSVLTSDYRLKRVLGFIAPGYDPADISYQVNGSLKAIRAGGLWGKGIGQGTLKLRSVPYVQSDFVFSAWAEETGFVGVLLFAGLWAFLLWRAWRAAFRTPDLFRSLLCFGMASYLGIQTLVNVMVVVGAIPATGIPLPLFSAGGSSLLSVALAFGLVANVARDAVPAEGEARRG